MEISYGSAWVPVPPVIWMFWERYKVGRTPVFVSFAYELLNLALSSIQFTIEPELGPGDKVHQDSLIYIHVVFLHIS